jgi:hypothetical protein
MPPSPKHDAQPQTPSSYTHCATGSRGHALPVGNVPYEGGHPSAFVAGLEGQSRCGGLTNHVGDDAPVSTAHRASVAHKMCGPTPPYSQISPTREHALSALGIDAGQGPSGAPTLASSWLPGDVGAPASPPGCAASSPPHPKKRREAPTDHAAIPIRIPPALAARVPRALDVISRASPAEMTQGGTSAAPRRSCVLSA